MVAPPDQDLITALPMEVTAVIASTVPKLQCQIARTNWRGNSHKALDLAHGSDRFGRARRHNFANRLSASGGS
jgi:hypothetical protein